MSEDTPIERTRTAEDIRKEYRRDLVGTRIAPRGKTVTVFGKEIEVRQPTLDTIIGQNFAGTAKEQLVNFIIQFSYIPGTDVQIFEAADAPQILKWPFGPDFIKLQDMLNEVIGVDIDAAEEELQADPLDD